MYEDKIIESKNIISAQENYLSNLNYERNELKHEQQELEKLLVHLKKTKKKIKQEMEESILRIKRKAESTNPHNRFKDKYMRIVKSVLDGKDIHSTYTRIDFSIKKITHRLQQIDTELVSLGRKISSCNNDISQLQQSIKSMEEKDVEFKRNKPK